MKNVKEMVKYRKAGKIANEIKKFAKNFIREGMLLLDVAEKIEERIKKKADVSFPVNLCINEIAAHYAPSYQDKKIVEGLLKVDIGVHVDGYIADTSFSLNFGDEKNEELIKASEEALKRGIEVINRDVSLGEVGKVIESTINEYGFKSIANLSGHSLNRYELHSGVTIPNYDNGNKEKLKEGFYAIEPFATNGIGEVKNSLPSEIYKLIRVGNVYGKSRKILKFIIDNYKTLPFSSRWLIKEFGRESIMILNLLEKKGIIHRYNVLIEKGKGKVSQSENTIYFDGDKAEILT